MLRSMLPRAIARCPYVVAALPRYLLMPPCRHAEDACRLFRACHALRHACFYADALPF